jgi:signal transduction histidine kinase
MSGIDITDREEDRERIQDLNDFFYILNRIAMHDLRNRLMAINGYIDLYQMQHREADLTAAIGNAEAGVEALRRLEILSRSIQTRPEAVPWDLRPVAESVARSSRAPERIQVIGECRALVDEAFSSVLENIVGNAFRHGKAERVEIVLEERGEEAVITISDNGGGVPDDIKDKIFTSGFTHGDSGNTGMGLFIARKLVEAYGGRIEVMDNHPRGSSFRIWLRRAMP